MVSKRTKSKGIIAAIVTVALAVSTVAALTGCQTETEVQSNLTPQLQGGTTITDGTLTVGVNASNSPYAGVNSNNETVGFDVDVAAAIADELGMKLQIVDVNSNGRSALSNGQVDVAMGVTKSGNADTVTYTPAYINDGASLFCLEANRPVSVSDIDTTNSKILVQGETTAAYTVQAALGAEAVQATSTMQEAFDALESGEQKYLVADAVIGSYFARNYSDVVRVDFLSADSVTPMYAITLTANSEVSATVSNALNTITQNGVLRVIEAKWLGTQGEALLPGQVDISTLPKTSFGK